MMPKPVALVLSLGISLLTGCANHATDQAAEDRSQHGRGKMAQDQGMHKKCAEMMRHQGKHAMSGKMQQGRSDEQKMTGNMKGCQMKNGMGADSPPLDTREHNAPEGAEDHSAHRP